jgi:hypothetical protein
MAERKPFLLRMDPRVLAALQGWADDDLRSLNGQIEYLLRQAMSQSGRARSGSRRDDGEPRKGKS